MEPKLMDDPDYHTPLEFSTGRSQRQVGHSGQSVASISCPGSDSTKLARLNLLRAKIREEELQKEFELLKAKNEVKLAELALECEGEADVDVQVDSVTKVKGYLQGCDKQDSPFIQAPVSCPRPDLPRVELETFDGNPRRYWRFTQQFKYYIEDRVSDLGQRMLYLLHYCRGQAKEAIAECVMLPPSQAYGRALAILKDLYGREHVVARAVLDDLFKNLKPMHDGPQSLSRLSISLQNCHIALSQMNYVSDMDSVTTLERVLRTLPIDARRRWARFADDTLGEGREVTFYDLYLFVNSEARVARSRFGSLIASDDKPRQSEAHLRDSGRPTTSRNVFMSQSSNGSYCALCDSLHHVSNCSSFLNMSVAARWNLVKRKRLCFICLSKGHVSDSCLQDPKCTESGCAGSHHRLLHREPFNSTTTMGNCNSAVHEASNICLGVVPVRITGPLGCVTTYALLDSGSDVTLVEQRLLDEIGLVGSLTDLNLSTVNCSSVIHTVSLPLEVESLSSTDTITIERAFGVPSLPVNPPVVCPSEIARRYTHLRNTSFVDIPDQRVRLLLGEDVPNAHWPLDRCIGKTKDPYAVKTPLGWVLFGPLSIEGSVWKTVNHTHAEAADIQTQLKSLYDSEFHDLEAAGFSVSVEDQKAINIVDGSIALKDGHYEVGLPWKTSLKLPNNYQAALGRLHGLRRRFLRNPDLHDRYRNAMDDSIKKGYLASVTDDQLQSDYSPRWYLPHHPVINPKKPEKLRVVLDCAAKYNGISLNDCLYQGPDTTANLAGVLLRFRVEHVAVAADVMEMFMQVKVPLRDRGALRILWWDSQDLYVEPKEFQMTSHPFGATSSPFCANFALRRTIADCTEDCMVEVRQAVERNFYVDDCLASLADPESARCFVHQLTKVLEQGGFQLKKWISNIPYVLQDLSESSVAASVRSIEASGDTVERTLGLSWDAKADVFCFKFVFAERPVTRRGILSTVSSLFDPLGMVAPLLLPAKIMLQRLCKKQVGWDEKLSPEDVSGWHKWLKGMNALDELTIPRCIKPAKTSGNAPELHVFSDASEAGYGVVAYCRWCLTIEEYECRLLFAKSRVAPLKSVTVPRLELNAARLAARVADELKRETDLPFQRVFYWTDSLIVLYYLHNTTTRFSIFVANRVTTIRHLSSIDEWRHVPTADNPADVASRGVYELKDLSRWFKGPLFLELPEAQWPVTQLVEKVDGLELRGTANVSTLKNSGLLPSLWQLIYKHSEWFKLVKSVIWLSRFKTFLMMMTKPSERLTLNVGAPRVAEFHQAEHDLIRLAQHEAYDGVMKGPVGGSLSTTVAAKYGLSRLCPFLAHGVLYVGGRLDNLDWPHVAKHPAILPARHHVTELIIRHYHVLYGHSGVVHTLSELRRRYWVVQGPSMVKRIIHGCWTCRKNLATPAEQMMAPLPIERLQSGWHPFKFVGCDYFGPMLVTVGRRQEKRYGCIFTCMQTRAVHLEMAYSLSTDAFINVLMRFVARRGTPEKIISDNGSNFVGAEQELKKAINNLFNNHLSDELLRRNIEWQFNPPLSSHRGGIWERLIRSVRRILRSTCSEQRLDDDKLCTFLVEAERILNGRPIVPFPPNCSDRLALTPNDLLVLNNRMYGIVPPTLSERYVKGWQQVNYLTRVFWKRWIKEYVPLLQERTKWRSPKKNLKPGDVVLVISNQLPRERWPMGVVESCESSSDGLVRSVSVRTRDGSLRRDVRKLCLIEGYE